LGNTPVFLSIIKKTNKQVMNGIIKVSDPDNNRSLGTVKANAYFNMSDPRSKSGNIVLTASAFGYNDAVQTLNYKQTERDTLKEDVTLFGNFFMVTFEMERASKGANFILSGLNFFNEAAIMVPSSQGQLKEVLDMLNEKPTMRIRLEGYTNGNSRGNIISMGPSKNYFSLTKDQKTEKGSAKELSQSRADAAKSWLIDQGISADRIEAVGMGGDKPIYDAKSALARKNARLELTVLE
jgi:outer membrane protein OmpA-like peptidoglycan-associated protein